MAGKHLTLLTLNFYKHIPRNCSFCGVFAQVWDPWARAHGGRQAGHREGRAAHQRRPEALPQGIRAARAAEVRVCPQPCPASLQGAATARISLLEARAMAASSLNRVLISPAGAGPAGIPTHSHGACGWGMWSSERGWPRSQCIPCSQALGRSFLCSQFSSPAGVSLPFPALWMCFLTDREALVCAARCSGLQGIFKVLLTKLIWGTIKHF